MNLVKFLLDKLILGEESGNGFLVRFFFEVSFVVGQKNFDCTYGVIF